MYVLELPNIKELINRTYNGEMMVVYDEWCKQNCKGEYVIHSPSYVTFERFEDREAFREIFEMRII